MKECKKCGRLLPVENFKVKDGKPYYICKECEKQYMTEYRAKNRKSINSKHREYMEKYKSCESNKRKLKYYAREYARHTNNISEENFRGENKLEKGQTKYTKAQIIKMSRYNLTPEQFDALPDYCEVCGATKNLHIDHDHKTGKVRGTLCCNCNHALGLMKDDYKNIIRLANYLIK